MTEPLREKICRLIHRIAPDADTANLHPEADMREELDLDSMDFLRLLEAIHKELGVDIPDQDAARVTSLASLTAYVQAKGNG